MVSGEQDPPACGVLAGYGDERAARLGVEGERNGLNCRSIDPRFLGDPLEFVEQVQRVFRDVDRGLASQLSTFLERIQRLG